MYRRWDDRQERTAQIKALAEDDDVSLREIARRVGCNVETVRETLDPSLKARRNRERLARYYGRVVASAT